MHEHKPLLVCFPLAGKGPAGHGSWAEEEKQVFGKDYLQTSVPLALGWFSGSGCLTILN